MSESRIAPSVVSPIELFPKRLIQAIGEVERQQRTTLYVTGGTLRDWLLGRAPADLDITVKTGAEHCCKNLIDILEGGALVMLGTETEEAARVVWRGYTVDFSAFRGGANSIEDELHRRDFTINALAIALEYSKSDCLQYIIDPLHGRRDLAAGLLRCCPNAFEADPLRMLRGYRLQAELELVMIEDCIKQIRRNSSAIVQCANERVFAELDRIMMTGNGAEVFAAMAQNTLLWQIFPELREGVGVEQPGFHHKDVFDHSLLALACLEKVMVDPRSYFEDYTDRIIQYLLEPHRRKLLRWAALFHDVGKPATCSSAHFAGGRRTFYNHDQVGCRMFLDVARRLRMSGRECQRVGKLIDMHMHPFHLSNIRRKEPLSGRALLRICKRAGDDLIGVFVLAMADSLASQGDLKPEDMEQELALLFAEVQYANETAIQQVLSGKKLVNGHDLIEIFGLQPGPLFRRIFNDLEVARVEEHIESREQALDWLRMYLEKPKDVAGNGAS